MLGQSALIVGDALTAEKEFRKALEYGQPQAAVVPLLVDGDDAEWCCRKGGQGIRGRRSSTMRAPTPN